MEGAQMSKYRNDVETMNAVIDAMGALVFALVSELQPAQQEGFAKVLGRLALNEARAGRTTTESLLVDLHQAAAMAADR